MLPLAKAAGTIPIYCGDPIASFDLNPSGFIQAPGHFEDTFFSDLQSLVEDKERCEKLINEPLFRSLNVQQALSPHGIAEALYLSYRSSTGDNKYKP